LETYECNCARASYIVNDFPLVDNFPYGMDHIENRGKFISLRFPGFPIGWLSFGRIWGHIKGR
jgi:hypothetical protein